MRQAISSFIKAYSLNSVQKAMNYAVTVLQQLYPKKGSI